MKSSHRTRVLVAAVTGTALLVPLAASGAQAIPSPPPAPSRPTLTEGFHVKSTGLSVGVMEFHQDQSGGMLENTYADGTWQYDFGDGTVTEAVPSVTYGSHAYAEAGTYTITQTNVTSAGEVVVESQDVFVYPGGGGAQTGFDATVAKGWEAWAAAPKTNFSQADGAGVLDVYPGGKPVARTGTQSEGDSGLVDADVLTQFTLDELPTTGQIVTYVGVRGVDKKNEYRVKVIVNAKGKVSLEWVKLVDNKEQSLGKQAVKGLTYEAGRPLGLAAQVSGWDEVTLKAAVGLGTVFYGSDCTMPQGGVADSWQIERYDAKPGVLRASGGITVGSVLKNSQDSISLRFERISALDGGSQDATTPSELNGRYAGFCY